MKKLILIVASLIALSAQAEDGLGGKTFSETVVDPNCRMLPEYCQNIRENYERGYKIYSGSGELLMTVIVSERAETMQAEATKEQE